MYTFLGIISAISSILSFIFILAFSILMVNDKNKLAVKFLVLGIISTILAVCLNTNDVETIGRIAYYGGGTLLCIVGIFMSFALFAQEWKSGITGVITIIIGILFVFVISQAFGMKLVKQSPTKYYDKYGKSYYSEEDRDNANFLYDAYDAADEYRNN